VNHGLATTYRDKGCRCDDCRRAATRQLKHYRVATRADSRGRPTIPMRVPIDGIRRHIDALLASGYTCRGIAWEVGITTDHLYWIRRGPSKSIHRERARQILAIAPLPDPADVVDPVVVERLCADPTAWRHGLPATRAERLAAAHILGAWSHKALGYSGSDAKRGAA
jgi:hypothetical protein